MQLTASKDFECSEFDWDLSTISEATQMKLTLNF